MAEPSVLAAVLADLESESLALQAILARLDDREWLTPTPSPGWTVAHQVAHLAWTDAVALLAVSDPAAFAQRVAAVGAGAAAELEAAAQQGTRTAPGELLAGWQEGRDRLARALAAAPPDARVPWFGPPMSPVSMATARTMETWAHGRDVRDALGVDHPAGPALRQVARLGVRTRDFAFAVNGVRAPAEEFRVELAAPDGGVWTWGPADAGQRVTGPAEDFCLLVTRRRHRADLALRATGPDADRWLDLAQAFAGPPGAGRRPSSAERPG